MKNERPVFVRRLNGRRVTVWANETDGHTWYSTVFTRHYKEGDKWRDVSTFNGLGDLALLGEAVELARDFIRRREDEQDTAADEGRDDPGKPMREKTKKPAPAAAGKQSTVNDTDSPK